MKFYKALPILIGFVIVISGCVSSLPNETNSKVNSCIQRGSFNGNNYCSEELCPNGKTGYFAAITCLGELAKEVSKTDRDSAEIICNRVYEITENQFKGTLMEEVQADIQKDLCISELE